MLKKEAKELVIKWAEIIAKGAGQGVMTHPNSDERRQILEAIRVMKNLTKHNSRTIQSAEKYSEEDMRESHRLGFDEGYRKGKKAD